MNELLMILVHLLVLGLVYYLVEWVLGLIGVPPQIQVIVRVIFVVIVVIYLINVLLGFTGNTRFLTF